MKLLGGFFSLGLKKLVEFLILMPCSDILLSCLFGEKMLLGLGRALVMGDLCTQQVAIQAPLNPPQKYFLAFPSSLVEEADGGCCRDREEQPAKASPWARTCVEWWRPQILIICPSPGVNCWPTALTAGARKLLISSLQSSGSVSHSPSLIYPRASWLPAKDYCPLSSKLLVQAWCHCCQSLCSLLGHNLHSSSIFSLAKRGGQWEGKSILHLWAQHIYIYRVQN